MVEGTWKPFWMSLRLLCLSRCELRRMPYFPRWEQVGWSSHAPEREIHDTRLLSDPSAPPFWTSLGVRLAWYRADGYGHPVPGCAPGGRAG